jgi:CRP-like cAMP-binding protein
MGAAAAGGPKGSHSAQPSALGLRRVALLQDLPEAVLDALARECSWRTFDPEQTIIARDADDRNVYFIISGRVQVTMYSRRGRQVTFDDQVAGELLGELSAIDGARRALDVIAVEPTLVAALSPATFMQLVFDQPLVAERVLRRLARLLRNTAERVIELSTLGVQNRIHAELLRLATRAGVRANAACLDPAPKHTDIANRVSTNREQVTREISALVMADVLAREGSALRILDIERLAHMVREVRGLS